MAIKTTDANAAVAGISLSTVALAKPDDSGLTRSASAAQIARTRWKNGNQRKLHRKRPAVGIIESKSTSKSRTSSHLILLMSSRPRLINPAARTGIGTSPQASSVAVCGVRREEKLAQFTVHEGRISPGSAAGGTSHCQCADAACNSRAEP